MSASPCPQTMLPGLGSAPPLAHTFLQAGTLSLSTGQPVVFVTIAELTFINVDCFPDASFTQYGTAACLLSQNGGQPEHGNEYARCNSKKRLLELSSKLNGKMHICNSALFAQGNNLALLPHDQIGSYCFCGTTKLCASGSLQHWPAASADVGQCCCLKAHIRYRKVQLRRAVADASENWTQESPSAEPKSAKVFLDLTQPISSCSVQLWT